MSIETMTAKVKELRELRRMAEELQAEITSIEDEIKAVMTAQETETLTGADWKITWKSVTSSRVDTKALKAGPPRCGGAFHQDDHHPPLLRGMRRSRYPGPSKHG